MNSGDEFLNAVIPRPYTILGLKLRPLSIGHLLLMEWQDLFWTHEPEPGDRGLQARAPTLDDLISGCLICSMRFRVYQEFLQRSDLHKDLRKLGKGLDLAALPERFNLFIQYFQEGMQQPEIEMPDSVSSGVLQGSPFLQCIRICLMSKLHMGAEETFDYPFRQALWDCFSLREAEGKLQIIGAAPAFTQEMSDAIAVCQEMNKQMFDLIQASKNQ